MGITKRQLLNTVSRIKEYIDNKVSNGKSISSVNKDSDENLIIIYTDGTSENLGKISAGIQGSFLTESGVCDLRFYNNKLQYYNTDTSTWVDTSITPDNIYIINMAPQPMKNFEGFYDIKNSVFKLKWEEPNDTIIDNQVAVIVEKVIIRRKLGSAPVDETDGDLVIEIKRGDFGLYKNNYYIDHGVENPNIGDIYYYKAFPVSTTGFYCYNGDYSEISIECKEHYLFGFKIDQTESDPDSMITYLDDCDNAKYTSAYMDYNTDTFNYGDWKDAWFIRDLKPCMLKYDGTVDYELNKNDYTKKIDGTDSDISNDSYEGNAMIGFPKVYWKIVDNGDNTANVYISDIKPDSNFHCWSHIDNNGNEIDYCYMPIYIGSNVNNKLRSLSGKTPINNQSGVTEITYAKANNLTDDIIWYTEVFCDKILVNLLLLLIGKSTNTQALFGKGHYTGGSSTSSLMVSGTLDTKGLFYGTNGSGVGVKVFGIEHWWGNQWRRIGGWINSNGTQKIKLTYGESDGSTTTGYNTDGSGYITIANSTPRGTSGGYISKMIINEFGMIPVTASGSASTYYCDGLWINNSQVDYAYVGGPSSVDYRIGAFATSLGTLVTVSAWNIGASISCKPLAKS